MKTEKTKSAALVFTPKPKSWGLRGDPYLWDELQTLFSAIDLSCSQSEFISHFERSFFDLTQHAFEGDDFEIERYATGGMSSGQISMEFWKKEALPLLLSRLDNEQKLKKQ